LLMVIKFRMVKYSHDLLSVDITHCALQGRIKGFFAPRNVPLHQLVRHALLKTKSGKTR